MIPLFGDRGLKLLRAFSLDESLLAFDFDGTLAPIVPQPEDAAMRPKTRALLTEVAARYPTVVISGRSRADVCQFLDDIPLRAIVGNHGMEPKPGMNRPLSTKWHWVLEPQLGAIPGLRIENKGMTLAIHYRHAKNQARVHQRILALSSQLPGVRIIEGKKVVNLLPAKAPDKASALLALCRRFRRSAALFLGDDDNDEAVFQRVSRTVEILGIRVGHSSQSHARLYVPSQRSVDRLLTLLLRDC